jgi:hypothetical protein
MAMAMPVMTSLRIDFVLLSLVVHDPYRQSANSS